MACLTHATRAAGAAAFLDLEPAVSAQLGTTCRRIRVLSCSKNFDIWTCIILSMTYKPTERHTQGVTVAQCCCCNAGPIGSLYLKGEEMTDKLGKVWLHAKSFQSHMAPQMFACSRHSIDV